MAAGWCVPIQTASGNRTIEARFFVDASGRTSGVAPRGQRFGPATIALSARWRTAAVPPGTVLVEASTDAWCWGAVTADGAIDTAAFVDMASCAGQGRTALMERLVRLLRESELFGLALRNATPGRLRISDATPMATTRAVERDAIRVGDVAFVPDPLSSQGVQCALRSGVQAASVVHTI